MINREVPICHAKVGQHLRIPLNSNPSTGYRWTITNKPDFLRLVDETFVPDPHPPGWVGAGGTQVFTFLVECAGDGLLCFVYRRGECEGGSFAIRVIATP